MVIVRPKKFPGPQYDVADIVRKQMGQRGPTVRPLDRIKQTKIFLRAKMHGASTSEARHLSNLPTTESLSQIMNAPLTQPIIAELCKEEEFRDPGLVKRLKEMWNHKKVKAIKVSGPSMMDAVPVEEDDTDMWKYAMDKVLNLRGYLKTSKDTDDAQDIIATQGITFNVLQLSDEKK